MKAGGSMRTAVLYTLAGAAFWLPEVLLAAVFHKAPVDAIGTLATSILLPIFLFGAYFALRQTKGPSLESRPSLALFMGIGVWISGPLSMTLVATFAGTGFTKWNGVSDTAYLLLFSVFPIYTLMMSAYNGTIAALLLTSAILIVVHFSSERDRWLIPPNWKRHLHFRDRRTSL